MTGSGAGLDWDPRMGMNQDKVDVGRIHYPPDLPITARKDDIIAAIQEHPVVIIAGETGSGNTTQIPKMCLAAGLGGAGRIGCTQPRRLAALSISRRIARELRCSMREVNHILTAELDAVRG